MVSLLVGEVHSPTAAYSLKRGSGPPAATGSVGRLERAPNHRSYNVPKRPWDAPSRPWDAPNRPCNVLSGSSAGGWVGSHRSPKSPQTPRKH